MSIRSFAIASLIVGLTLLLAGCGGDDNTGYVSGKVTYAGQAVKVGMVSFEPDGWKAQSHNIPIKDGQYGEVSAKNTMPPGKYVVRVTAPDISKSDMNATPGPNGEPPKMVPLLPPSWNHQSQLRAEIKSGQNVINFSGPQMGIPQMDVK